MLDKGYALFREMGVPTARSTHAIVRINGQAKVYAFVEAIDGRFTRSRFSEGGKGNLYKEIWPVHDDAQAYVAALKTNEDEQPSVDRILRFGDAIREGTEAMARFLDKDIMTSYMAVDRVLMNDDGAFNLYCIPQGAGNNPSLPGNHNFWYEAAETDRFWLIPWDLDDAMVGVAFPPHVNVDFRTEPTAAPPRSCRELTSSRSPAVLQQGPG